MDKQRHNGCLGQVFGGFLFAGLGLASIVFFLKAFPPAPYQPPEPAERTYDRTAMQEAMAPEAMRASLVEVAAFGSRAPGQPGHTACAERLRAAFLGAGLELFEQELETVHPICESVALTIDGQLLDLPLWPALPNHVQPMVTPVGGLSGTLLLVDDDSLRVGRRFDDQIAVVDLAKPLSKQLGLEAERFAELGFQAVLATHSEGFEKINWDTLASLTMRIPFNYVRLVAGPELLEQIGRTARIDVRTAFQAVENRTFVGRLRGGRSDDRALVLCVQYDGFSMLPDLMHGSTQALQVATQLQLLAGLLPHRDELKRDVIVIATGSDFMAQNSLNQLLEAVGRNGEAFVRQVAIQERQRDNAVRLAMVRSVSERFAEPEFAIDGPATAASLARLDRSARDFFTQELQYVLKLRVLAANERLLQAQILFERQPDNLQSPEYRAFRKAKTEYDRINTASSLPVQRLLEANEVPGLRGDLQARFRTLLAFHESQQRRLEQGLAINRLVAGYRELVVISPALIPPAAIGGASETLSFTGGLHADHGAAADAFARLLEDAVHNLGLAGRVRIDYRGLRHGHLINQSLAGMPVQAQMWSTLSFPAFTAINPGNDYKSFKSPLPSSQMDNLAGLEGSLQVLGETVLSIAHGSGQFPPLKVVSVGRVRGRVYASGVGSSVVPNFPVAGALMCSKDVDGKPLASEGAFRSLLMFTDPYGAYRRDVLLSHFGGGAYSYTPEAARFAASGLIDHYKDSGMTAQNIYKSVGLRMPEQDVNLVLYRSTPVAVLNRINPQTMKEFSGADFLRTTGLINFPNTAKFVTEDGILEFINPRERFFVALKAGSAENELVATTRAFCLGVLDADFEPDPDREIDGRGYLAQDTPLLRNIAAEAAASMAFLNDKRIALQEPYGMIDEMTMAFHRKGLEYEAAAKDTQRAKLARLRDYSQALTYAILNHPIIRNSISEAIWGILWYMGLLVPFVFFFEKLVFGFTDVRKQLVAQGVVFLVVFGLLRFLHPAFHMIRSSIMILLGFVIILISGGITILLSSKFRENLEALHKLKGHVKGAHVNKMGIMVTAFMLGLNNMHRRKVRTGLTCATLVLMTFVMICFTSVQSDIVDQTRALGRAPYQGLLIKNEEFAAISGGEIAALTSRYGEEFVVNERMAMVGTKVWGSSELVTPQFEVVAGEGGQAQAETLKSALLFRHSEPLRQRIKLLTSRGWFTEAQADATEGPYPILLPARVAELLGLTVETVDDQEVVVKVNGTPFVVHGIFDGQALADVIDLDADNLLPFNTEALVNPKGVGLTILADKEDPRMPGNQLLIGLYGKFAATHTGNPRIVSVAVDMGSANFRTARTAVDTYLEQSGRGTYYGLDGIAYLGRRARETSMAGLADMLIPLVIAALTVLNTMKGSVYERRDEIYVYNAVGIAPRYVFFMFIAEAMVYAVVGALLGYILSQGTGRVLTWLDLTGGLNMNFTSLSTVYASLTIVAATFLSTYFPARSAMEIAKPTEDAGWSLPTPEDDTLSFNLPFTFTHYDRVAVLGFFHNFFVNHGEGSAGPFFAGDPKLGVCDRLDPLAGDSHIPMLVVTVWLKPFDLGVSQRLEIELPTDPETGEYISCIRLTRLTGSRESWNRLNHPFVAHLRRHFLHWRAVSDDMKKELYGHARGRLEATLPGRTA